jgi:hypothetical protein
MFKVIMANKRRLKKGGDDLEAEKQNVVSLELTIGEQNVVPLEPRVDESSSQCGLKATMVVVCNLNDETPPNTNWEFLIKT